MKSCKTCRHLGVAPSAKGRRVVRADSLYQCLAQVVLPPLPDSVTRPHGGFLPIHRTYMAGDDGTRCPTWEGRK